MLLVDLPGRAGLSCTERPVSARRRCVATASSKRRGLRLRHDPTKLPTGCTARMAFSTATAVAAQRPAPWSRSAEEQTGQGRPRLRGLVRNGNLEPGEECDDGNWPIAMAARHVQDEQGFTCTTKAPDTQPCAQTIYTANALSCQSSTVLRERARGRCHPDFFYYGRPCKPRQHQRRAGPV